jgi:hypothetical protein
MEDLGRSAGFATQLIDDLNELEIIFEGEIKKKGKDFNLSARRAEAIGNSIGRKAIQLVDDLSLKFSNKAAAELRFIHASGVSAKR